MNLFLRKLSKWSKPEKVSKWTKSKNISKWTKSKNILRDLSLEENFSEEN